MNEILGRKIIRWDTEKSSLNEIVKIILILDDGKRVTIEGLPYTELNVYVD